MTTKVKSLMSLVSIILVAVMLVQLPLSVTAQVVDTQNADSNVGAEIITDELVNSEDEPQIISEVESARTENEKHYRLADGSFMAVQYGMPVHFKDSSGKWIEYDNSLELKDVTDEETLQEDIATADEVALADATSQQEYVNKTSNVEIKLSKKSKESNMVKLKYSDYAVSWGYVDTNKSTARLVEDETAYSGNEAIYTLENATQEVIYENIYQNVDLQSFVMPQGVKENLVLKSANVADEYLIAYKINGLSAVQKDEQTVELLNDKGEAVYVIAAPFMIDAKGINCFDVALSIEENINNKLTLKLTIDKNWLLETDRQFPVSVDPQFFTKQTWNSMSSSYIDSGNPNTNYGYDGVSVACGTVYVGTLGEGNFRTLIKVNELPTLNKGDMIVNAKLNMHLFDPTFYDDMYMGAYELNGTWSEGTATWNNQPSHNSNAVDYIKVAAGSVGWVNWDITKSIKSWYNGKANYGLIIKTIGEIENLQCAGFYSAKYDESTIPKPNLLITYRNNKGLEDYWSYTSASVGTAGTAQINDYSGNMVYSIPVASTSGLKLPVEVSLVYNSYMANSTFKNAKSYVGKGWKLNIQQTFINSTSYGLTGDSNEMFKYVYTDADGTEHYFYKKTENNKTTYVDEDGLGFELSINNSSTSERFTITNEEKYKWTFNSSGYLTSIKDESQNALVLTYNGSNQIQKIKDANEKEITFTTGTDGYITSISYPGGRATTLGYDSNKMLTSVSFNYGENSSNLNCTYQYSGGLLTYAHNFDSSKCKFMYKTDSSAKGVREIQEFGTNGTIGQKIRFDRSKYNTTTKQVSVDDDTYDNSDDIITTMQFDNFGRTISLQSKTIDQEQDFGAQNYRYTDGTVDSTGSNVKKLNRISTDYALGANTTNLLLNHNLESMTNWTALQLEGSATFTATSDSTQKLFGQKSIKINVTNATEGATGRVYQYVSPVYVEPNTDYTLSAYVKTVGVQDNFGACVIAQQINSTTENTVEYSDYITGTTDTAVDNGWRRVSVSFKTTSDISKIGLSLGIRGGTGTAYFDGVQLEKTKTASSYNMLQNSSFELHTSNVPNNWSNQALTSSDITVTTEKQSGNRSYKIIGGHTATKGIFQDVAISGTEDDTYIISAWSKCSANPLKSDINNRIEIAAKITYSDGTTKWKSLEGFNYAVDDWQYSCVALNLSDETSTVKTPTKLTVTLRYFRQTNAIYFDNIQLIKEPVPSYTYDDDGNLVTVTANAEQKSTMEYSDGNLTKYIDAKGGEYTYTYVDNTKKVDTATNQRGVVYDYDYDTAGNATSLTASNGDLHLKSTVEYREKVYYEVDNGQEEDVKPTEEATVYEVTVSDQNNYPVTSTYDNTRGTLLRVSDSLTGTTNYTYNDYNQTTNISHYCESIDETYQTSYGYDSSLRLSTINHNGTQYSFAYDEYGNKTQVSVGNQVLSTYNYKPFNRALESFVYGNGVTVGYTYDRFGNESERTYNGVVKYRWTTDNSGTVSHHEDIDNQIEYNIDYDTLGRAIRYHASTTDVTVTNKSLYSVEYGYDLNNNITKVANATKTGSNTVKYTYGDDNLPEKTILDNNKEVSYTYDGLGRTTGVTVNTVSPITNSYTYQDSLRVYPTEAQQEPTETDKYTTTRIDEEIVAGERYKYYYDEVGNIVEVKKYKVNEFDTYLFYEYDEQNQLTYAYDALKKEFSMYEYDLGGNLTKVDNYAYIINSSVPTLVDSITYGYTDENWKDKLTSYDGQTITCDAIGNPLTYRDGMTMTWEKGRQLASLQQGETSISYTYDADGMRMSKTVNGTKYTYQYIGGMLLQETRGNAIIDYSYDASGTLYALRYKASATDAGTYYYYARNWRGDIIGLYDANGTLIATYDYNAWGKPQSVKDANGTVITDQNHIANINPFRYRGYYYDTETGLYYLQSRYYDPLTGRFINADGYVATGVGLLDTNMFAYCINNPVNMVDLSGEKNYPVDFIGPIRPEDSKGFLSLEILKSGFHCTHAHSFPIFKEHSANNVDNNLNIALGSVRTGKYNGWTWRIDSANTYTKTQKHIHIYKQHLSYSQNIDGTPHDDSEGSPPKSIKKELKNRGIWDWDSNEQKNISNDTVSLSREELFVNGRINQPILYTMPIGVSVPSVNVAFPVVSPAFSFSTVLIF